MVRKTTTATTACLTAVNATNEDSGCGDDEGEARTHCFEELVIMKFAWGPDLYDMAAWNESQVEEVDNFDFEELLLDDADCLTWDKDLEMGLMGGDELIL